MKIRSLTRLGLLGLATVFATITGHALPPSSGSHWYNNPDNSEPSPYVGAVYAMSNKLTDNTVVGYGRNADGTITFLGEYLTGGDGATDFDDPDGLDPLISSFAVLLSDDRRFLFAVNAGSNNVSSFRIRDDLSLQLVDVVDVEGIGPNSLAYRNGILYVSVIDADGITSGPPDAEGAVEAFRVTRRGRLRSLPRSRRVLENRPATIQFSPDGRFLVVSAPNAGSLTLPSGSNNSVLVYGVRRNGRLTRNPLSGTASTFRDDPQGRNLPSAIGMEVVRSKGRQYVVLTEARGFQTNGEPPAFPNLQAGSVSTWEITRRGDLVPINLDVVVGSDMNNGERTTCWIEFSKDGEEFWVVNALDSSISTFTFDQGQVALYELQAAQGSEVTTTDEATAFGVESDGFIDLWLSDDGEYLYQLLGLRGGINVYKAADDGSLTLIQEVRGDLPVLDTQAIVAF